MSTTSKASTDIADMLLQAESRETRSILIVCQALTAALETMIQEIAEDRRDYNRRHAEHATQLDSHNSDLKKHEVLVIQGQTTLRNIKGLLSFVLLVSMTVSGYGYTLIAGQHDELVKYAHVIPQLEMDVRELKKQKIFITESTKDNTAQDAFITENTRDNVTQDNLLDSINNNLERLNNKKVIKASR